MRIDHYRKTFLNYWLAIISILLLTGCANKQHQNPLEIKPGHLKYVQKPGSTYQDSIIVNTPAAVFYHPDSLQLQKLKSLLNDQVFTGSMHEFLFMVRNAHMFLHKNWADLKIIEATNLRYLVFHHNDGSREVIDIDKEQDPVGMLVFDGRQKPLLIDMTNIDTQLPFYFHVNKMAVNEAVK